MAEARTTHTIPWVIDHAADAIAKASIDRPAIHFEDITTWTYGDVIAASHRWAAGLQALGVEHGDRVGLLSRNSLDYWAAYFGIVRLGAIVVRLNFRLAAAELEYALNDSGAVVLVAEAELAERVAPVIDRTAVRATVVPDRDVLEPAGVSWAAHCAGAPPAKPVAIDATDRAMIMYTSGTTGRPKGALWTHSTTTAFTLMQAAEYRIGPDTVGFVTGPMYHIGALETLCLPSFLMGGQAVFMRSGAFEIERAIGLIERLQVTDAILFPFMIYELVSDGMASRYDLSRLQTIITGGDPLLPWAVEALADQLPWTTIIQNYGLTEGSPVATCARTRIEDELGTVGYPLPFTSISIRDDDGNPVPAGREGEVWVRGPAVSEGYWEKPDATRAAFIDGWCRTGDLGRVSVDGKLVIAGRKKDMIRSGGENIYSAEIEDVLARHPAIADVAVIGVPDAQFIETVAAVVVVAPGQVLDPDDVVAWSRDHLASYKKPRHVFFVDELPRTASGKVMKYQLREQLGPLASREQPV